MAFLDSPILKSRRFRAISPETARKFQLAKEHSNKELDEDFKRIHQTITQTQKSFTLFDSNANANAITKMSEISRRQAEQLELVREQFNKVKVSEKQGFAYDKDLADQIEYKLTCTKLPTMDVVSGMCDINLSAPPIPTPTNSPINAHVYSKVYSTDLEDTESCSSLSDIEMDIVGIAKQSLSHEWDESIGIESPPSETYLSQKSLVLSSDGMFSVDSGDQGFEVVKRFGFTGNAQNKDEKPEVEELPKCFTCAPWDFYRSEYSEYSEMSSYESDRTPDSPLTCEVIDMTKAENGSVKACKNVDSAGNDGSVLISFNTTQIYSPIISLKLESFLENELTVDVNSDSDCDSLETTSLKSSDFEVLDITLSEMSKIFEKQHYENLSLKGSSNKVRNDRIKSLLAQAKGILHSASDDFSRFGLKKSFSKAHLQTLKSNSTSSFSPTRSKPQYNLSSTLLGSRHDRSLNLDTQLQLGNQSLVELDPLERWNRAPNYADTTSGHKAWYKRSQSLIENRRKEIVNTQNMPKDIDVIVSY